jgi:hypothetical protein
VAGIVNPSGPTTGSAKPVTPSGGGDQRSRVDALAPVELQVGVRQGAEREDAGLRVGHGA